jgi:hypothetical protein
LAGGSAFGLEFLKLAERFFELTLQALLIKGEVDECLGVLAEDVRGCEGGVDLRVVDVDLGGGFEVADDEHAVLDSSHTIEAPLADHLRFSSVCISGIRPDQSIGFVGFEVFFGEDDNAAGESVAEGVDAGTGFAFGGAGAGRFLAFARLAAIWASDVGVMVWLLAMGIACGWGGIGGGKE